jgi:hypothetical protein
MTPKPSDMPIGWVTDFTDTRKRRCTSTKTTDLQKTAQTGKTVTAAFKKSSTTEIEGAAVMFATACRDGDGVSPLHEPRHAGPRNEGIGSRREEWRE